MAARTHALLRSPFCLALFAFFVKVAVVTDAMPWTILTLKQEDSTASAGVTLVAFLPVRAVVFGMVGRREIEFRAIFFGKFIPQLLSCHRFRPWWDLPVEEPDVAAIPKTAQRMELTVACYSRQANKPAGGVSVPKSLEGNRGQVERFNFRENFFVNHGLFSSVLRKIPVGPAILYPIRMRAFGSIAHA